MKFLRRILRWASFYFLSVQKEEIIWQQTSILLMLKKNWFLSQFCTFWILFKINSTEHLQMCMLKWSQATFAWDSLTHSSIPIWIPFSSDNILPKNLEILSLFNFFKRRDRTHMKHAALTYPEVKCLSIHTNGMQQWLYQKVFVCYAVHMPQHSSESITFTEKQQSSLQRAF